MTHSSYWAVLHISSGTITTFSDIDYCFNAFTNKQIIRSLLNDAIVDYNVNYPSDTSFFTKTIRNRFGESLSPLDFTLVRIKRNDVTVRLFCGLDRWMEPNYRSIAMFANEYLTDD